METRWSIVLGAGASPEGARAALAWLFRQYADPLHAHVRRRGCRDPEDAVQDFLLHLLEHNALAAVDRSRGRFRSWLLTCLDNFLANRRAATRALKRGGDAQHAPLREDEHGGAEDSAAFDRDWAQAVLGHAEDRLRGETDAARWQALSPYLYGNGSAEAYGAAGVAIALSEGAIKVAVHRLRTRLRELVREGIAETLADPSPQHIDAELDHLLAALSAGNRAAALR